MRTPSSQPCMRTLALAAVLAAAASANVRHFGYAYETAVLPPGAKEIEGGTTARLGKTDFYSGLDQRLEFEVGLPGNVMTSLYLNWSNVTAADAAGNVQTAFESKGVSNEWKWKLLDPSADAVGLGLYGEISYSTDAIELEPKVLIDKQIGPCLVALNLVSEESFDANADGYQISEYEPEAVLGATYEATARLHLGLEARSHTQILKDDATGDFNLEYSALFLGPVISYASEGWWVTLSVMPQLPALKTAGGGSILELGDQEKFDARLLFSFHL